MVLSLMRANATINEAVEARLLVGPYQIIIMKDENQASAFRLPEAAQCFVDDGIRDKEQPDFTYIISASALPDVSKYDCIASCNTVPTPYEIYRIGENTYLWIRYNNQNKVRLAYVISEGWSKWRLIADSSSRFGRDSFSSLVYIFAYSVLNKSGIMLHGVVMEWSGMGIIVCAHSGVGKSTHTNMWEDKENALIINGDKALCYRDKDMWFSCGAPWCGTSGKFVNKSVAIKAIILLERGHKNCIFAVSPLQAAINLIELTYAPSWNEFLMARALDLLDDLVAKVPVYRLYCTPDYEAVQVLKQELQNLIGG